MGQGHWDWPGAQSAATWPETDQAGLGGPEVRAMAGRRGRHWPGGPAGHCGGLGTEGRVREHQRASVFDSVVRIRQ